MKSFKDEDVHKFMQYIEKQAKAYDFNLTNRSYDIHAFAKYILVWIEKQGEQEEPQVYETEDGEIITYSETDGYKFVEPNFHEGDWVVNKFGPKTLSPFDKVLVKISNESYNIWFADFVAEPAHVKNETPLILGAKEANMVIPYNDETKHLVGTAEEAPEYYRYWED